ncbi:hypothetical protein F4810DRAFT_707558 [Camillea tinctor]|nr:hypothetical protein F4810DRAFT_707558 [Camillea tinctor]
MRVVGDWHQQMRDTARRPQQNSWFITNLGVLDGQPKPDGATASDGQDSTRSVRRAQFAASAETTSAALIISPMTVAGEQIMADLEKWLIEIGSSES